MRIAKIAGIAIIAKIFSRVAGSHRTVFNFGNYPILAIRDHFLLLSNAR